MVEQLKLPGSASSWLGRRHPCYAAMLPHWSFLEESYRGGPQWFNDANLPKYPSEHPQKYAHRKASATRDNYTAMVVDQHTGYLFKQKPTRDGDDRLMAFWAAAKRQDGDMDDLAAEMATESAKTGRCVVIVDKPAVAALTAADDRLPYAYTVSVCDLLDWARGEDGDLLWALTQECSRNNQDPKDPDNGGVQIQYRLRTRDGWELWTIVDGAPVFLGSGTWKADGSTFGRVPVVIVDHQDGCDEYAPPGLVDEIARIDRVIAQEETSLHEVVEWLGAPTLCYPGESDEPLTLGVAGVITYSEQSPTAPAYLTPDAAHLANLQARIDALIAKVRELASLPSKTTNQSGVAKMWDSQPLQARLSAKAANLQAAEMEIASIADLFMGGDGQPECSIQYPKTFDVTALADDVANAMALDEIPGKASPTYRVQLYRAIARKSLPDLDTDTQQTIDEEIEANVTADDELPGPDDMEMMPDGQMQAQEAETEAVTDDRPNGGPMVPQADAGR